MPVYTRYSSVIFTPDDGGPKRILLEETNASDAGFTFMFSCGVYALRYSVNFFTNVGSGLSLQVDQKYGVSGGKGDSR